MTIGLAISFERKIVKIFLPISLLYVLGAQKNHLLKTGSLTTHNICFGWETSRLYFNYDLWTTGVGDALL